VLSTNEGDVSIGQYTYSAVKQMFVPASLLIYGTNFMTDRRAAAVNLQAEKPLRFPRCRYFARR
jgi:hypothetical protein